MNGAQLLCRVLEKKGVTHVFGLFGDIQTDFAHAVRTSHLTWIGVHNEKSGGFMADIYARTSGRPGIIFTTLGPGATNVTSALANATQDRSPLIVISDQVPLTDFRVETHQFIDLQKAFHPRTGITKHTDVIRNVYEIPQKLKRAFKIATSEPQGAVHLSIPADIFGAKVVNKQIPKKQDVVLQSNAGKKSILAYADFVKMLKASKRGLIIAGGSIERAHAEKEFRSFIEKFDLPVLTTFRGKNAIETDHPQCFGTISRHLGTVLDDFIRNAAYIITIGYDYNEGLKPSLWKGKESYLYNIDSYDNRIVKIFYPPSLFGDLKKILHSLGQEDQPGYQESLDFETAKNKLKSAVLKALDVRNPNLHPQRIIDAVNEVYGENAIIVCDVGLNKYYSGLLLKSRAKNKIIFSNGQSAMAFSSGAMGAKLARPEKDVVALVGDGGFLMDPQEVLTAVAYKKPVTWIIFNNGGLGLIEQAQSTQNKKTHGVHFSKVFFAQLAKSLGAYGVHVNNEKNLSSILREVKKTKKPAVIDVLVEYTSKMDS